MKSVSQTFTDTLIKPSINVKRVVSYKRRYWAGSLYVWESAWTTLTEDKISQVSPLTSQLDTQTQNQFAVSTVTITLKNFDNEWNPLNTGGVFGPDAWSTRGYEPFWTKFQIQGGLIYSAGSSELVPLFTGVVSDLNFNTTNHEVQLTVNGLQDLLLRSDASNLATLVTAESLGTGNGSTAVFTTAHVGVAVVKSVSIAGAVKRAGVDYTLSQIADPLLAAKVTFIVAPAAATALTITYTYLAPGQKVEQLVTSLLNLAGIPPGNQQVSTVTFPTNIINTHTWQTQADWQTGTSLSVLDVTSQPNSVLFDFASTSNRRGAYKYSAGAWTQKTSGVSSAGVPPQIYAWMTGVNANELAYVPMVAAYGESGVTLGSGNTGPWPRTSYFYFMFNNFGTFGSNNFYQGYSIKASLNSSSGTGTWTINLCRHDSANLATETILGSASISDTVVGSASSISFKIFRYPSGRMVVSVNETGGYVLIMDVTDNTYQTSAYMGIRAILPTSAGVNFINFYQPAETNLTGTWIQAGSFDSGAMPTAWNTFNKTDALRGAISIVYSTRSSLDNSSWSGWTPVVGGTIMSPLNRYLQVQFDMTLSLTSSQNPIVYTITIGSLTSSTVLTMANFTGMTVYDAITVLAAFANYEFGFDASENFFFRAKSGSKTPLMTLTDSNFIVDLLSTQGGYDMTYSGVRATYGTYTSQVDDGSLGMTDPTPRFGKHIYTISEGGVLISADADLASNIAVAQYAYYKTPRRKIKIATKFLPQLDLSDVVSLAFLDFSVTPQWFWGDGEHYWGDPTIYYYGANQEALAALTAKVVGSRIDTDNWSCELDLEEVV